MKLRFIIPSEYLYIKDTKELIGKLLKFNVNNINLYDFICNNGGIYFIKHKVSNRYYVGSTLNYWWRIFSLRCGTSHRPRAIRDNGHWIVPKDLTNEYDIIILANSNCDNLRIKESRYIKLLRTFEINHGFNKTLSGTRGGVVGNKFMENKVWVTNCIDCNFCINEDDLIPEGFYPGRNLKSNVFNFFNSYGLELQYRNRHSEPIYINVKKHDLLPVINRDNLRSASMHIIKLENNLKKFYNINLNYIR